MRQLAMSMLMYINDNKGRFPAAEFSTIAGAYPSGWSWPNELVRQGYVKAPGLSVYKKPNSSTTDKVFNHNNVFRCPEGIDEDAGITGAAGDWPTDPKNNAFKVANDSACATEGFGIASWYQLNCRNESASNAWTGSSYDSKITKKGNRITPFMGFQSGSKNNMQLVKDAPWQRSMGMIKKSAEMLMMVEAADQNWLDQKPSNTYPNANLFLKRLGARHGKKTADGLNAWTNFAFFDGHVALYPTIQFEHRPDGTDDEPDLQTKEVIFYVNKQ
jgi:prepilin-type processing-associated H-X9-DG protein